MWNVFVDCTHFACLQFLRLQIWGAQLELPEPVDFDFDFDEFEDELPALDDLLASDELSDEAAADADFDSGPESASELPPPSMASSSASVNTAPTGAAMLDSVARMTLTI